MDTGASERAQARTFADELPAGKHRPDGNDVRSPRLAVPLKRLQRVDHYAALVATLCKYRVADEQHCFGSVWEMLGPHSVHDGATP